VAQALFLTGVPGVGKTTVIRRVAARLGECAGGFYTEEIREDGRRTGFRLAALHGPVGLLASVNIDSQQRVGKYGVHLQDLERVGVQALRRAVIRPDVAVVVVDEIGKMELFSAAFQKVVEEALSSPKPVLATVMVASQPWVNRLKSRSDVTLIEVTRANRQSLPERIFHWLQEIQGSTHSA
jgi:nucleoside-triphosphatase